MTDESTPALPAERQAKMRSGRCLRRLAQWLSVLGIGCLPIYCCYADRKRPVLAVWTKYEWSKMNDFADTFVCVHKEESWTHSAKDLKRERQERQKRKSGRALLSQAVSCMLPVGPEVNMEN